MKSELQEIASDSLKYWEVRRIVYNAVLGAITLGYFICNLPRVKTHISLDGVLGFFVLAVVANVLYSAVYLPDFLVQFSVFREPWRRNRWMLLVIGILVASIFTRWIVISTLGLDVPR